MRERERVCEFAGFAAFVRRFASFWRVQKARGEPDRSSCKRKEPASSICEGRAPERASCERREPERATSCSNVLRAARNEPRACSKRAIRSQTAIRKRGAPRKRSRTYMHLFASLVTSTLVRLILRFPLPSEQNTPLFICPLHTVSQSVRMCDLPHPGWTTGVTPPGCTCAYMTPKPTFTTSFVATKEPERKGVWEEITWVVLEPPRKSL